MARKNVVIVGGGFAGSYAAKHLEKEHDTTIIDTKDYFEFTPGILRTIVEPKHIKKIQVLHNHYLKYARVLIGGVKSISEDHVMLGSKKVKYDYLVIASGSSYEAPFKEQRVVTATRAGHLKDYYKALCKAKKVLIVGGGLVGVEMAGEICDGYAGKNITIVHSHDKLIGRNSKKAINYATKVLRKKGVNIVFNERVVGKKGGYCLLKSGKKVKVDLVFLCTGIKGNYDFVGKKFLGKRGIIVNKYLQLDDRENVFAIGDVNEIIEEKTAQNAERQAEVVVHNIRNLEKGEKLEAYKTKKTMMLISLGKHKAILESGDFTLTGWIPAVMKGMIEWWEMYKKRQA